MEGLFYSFFEAFAKYQKAKLEQDAIDTIDKVMEQDEESEQQEEIKPRVGTYDIEYFYTKGYKNLPTPIKYEVHATNNPWDFIFVKWNEAINKVYKAKDSEHQYEKLNQTIHDFNMDQISKFSQDQWDLQ